MLKKDQQQVFYLEVRKIDPVFLYQVSLFNYQKTVFLYLQGVDNAEYMIKETYECTVHVHSQIENATNLPK